MNFRRSRLLPLLLSSAAALLLASTPARAAKVAVIDLTHSPDTEAVLTAALAKTDGLEVLERAQMAKLVGEKQLNDLETAGKFSALGKLLGADGLIVLDKISLPNQPVQISGNLATPASGLSGQVVPPTVGTSTSPLTARLIGVTTGACLFVQEITDVPAERTDNAEWIAHLVDEKENVLTIAPAGLVPISVLNVRSDFNTADAQKLQSALKRLLDVQLGNMPGFLLLERRELGDVAFEKSLNAADAAPLLGSALQVEVGLSAWQSDGSFTLRFWLRHANGTQSAQVEIAGQKTAIQAAVERMAGEIYRLAGLAGAPPSGPAPREARQFVEEAYWAWSGQDHEAAVESLDSAFALGDASPDAYLLEENLAWEKFRALPQRPHKAGGPRSQGEKESPEDLAAGRFWLEQALRAQLAFQAAGGTVPGAQGHSPPAIYPVVNPVVESAAAVLQDRDEQGDPGWEEFRQLTHQVVTTNLDAMDEYTTQFGPSLAQSAGELLTWYERELFDPGLGTNVLRIPATDKTALGIRFRGDPEARQAWQELLQRALTAGPLVRARALLLQSGTGETAEQVEDYRAFLRELDNHLGELLQNGLSGLLAADRMDTFYFPNPRTQLRSRTSHERAELLITLLNLCPVNSYLALAEPRVIPDDVRPAFIAAYTEYRSRVLAAITEAAKIPLMGQRFASWERKLREQNPTLEIPPASAAGLSPALPLEVKKFWTAKLVTRSDFKAIGNSLWSAYYEFDRQRSRSGPADRILEISLADFAVRPRILPAAIETLSFDATPTALWLTGFKPLSSGAVGDDSASREIVLLRHDLKTDANTLWPLERQMEVVCAGERVFLRFDEGLFEVNPETGQRTLLISTRRRPAETPFDESIPFLSPRFIQGADGQAWMGVGSAIYAMGGGWPKIYDGFGFAGSFDDNTFLMGPQPDQRMGPITRLAILIRRPDGSTSTINNWSEPQMKYNNIMGENNRVAFKNGEMFQLDGEQEFSAPLTPGRTRPPIRVVLHWWFDGGPQEGVTVPLQFASQPDDLTSVYNDGGANDIAADQRAREVRKVFSVPSGLILSGTLGFWFIPNSDLDAYRQAFLAQANAQPATTATTAPVQAP